MELWVAIRELIEIVEEGIASSKEDEYRLAYLLDLLAFQMHSVDPEDGDEIAVPKTDNHFHLMEKAQERFPKWKSYTHRNYESPDAEVWIGNPYDDVADISSDLKEAVWVLENVGENAALDNLLLAYRIHWEWHARNLQTYLQLLHA